MMTFLDTNLVHVGIADQVCCTLPFAGFHNSNNPVLTHCNIQCTLNKLGFHQMHSYLKKNLICKQVW